jgi:outer membrane protein
MNKSKPSGGSHLVIDLVIIACSVLFSGCIHSVDERSLNEWIAPSADRVWAPPPAVDSEPLSTPRPVDIPEDLLRPEKKWQLTDIIEVTLRNNPETRSAWYAARAAAADWRSKQGDYYPQIDVNSNVSHIENIDSGPKTGQPGTLTGPSVSRLEPSLDISWLLFDFGGRESSIEEKRQALLAADFVHNAAIQDAVFLVLQTYFQYVNARVLEKSLETSLNEASVNLGAAQQRHHDGLATVADVLLAKTALSQAQLNLDVVKGQVQTIRGSLATAMGVPANTPYDIGDVPLNPPVNRLTEDVDAYIRQAEANRPDLAAQRRRVEQSVAHLRSTRSALYPNLVIENSLDGQIDDITSEWERLNTTTLKVNIPIFKGYSRRYDVLKAEQDAETQKAQLDSLGQTIVLQVWSSYFNLKTSAQRVKTSGDLLQSALQSYDVALGRYREGVGGFLDLLAAQSNLENARAQQATAQADWYISFAQLARDTGMLWRQKPAEQERVFDLFPTPTKKEEQP